MWKQWYVIQVPFDYINVFARGQVLSSERTATTTAFAAFTASIASALFSLKSHNSVWFGSGAVGLLGLAYYLDFVRAAQTTNYMAVFGSKDKLNCDRRWTPKASGPFEKADVAMFRIKNYHDYFNISLILAGKTGCTPVSEIPEAAGK